MSLSNMFEYSTLIFEYQQNGLCRQKRVTSKCSHWRNKDNTVSPHPSNYSGLSYIINYMTISICAGFNWILFNIKQCKYHISHKPLMYDFIFTTIIGNGAYVPVTSCLNYVDNVFVLDKDD